MDGEPPLSDFLRALKNYFSLFHQRVLIFFRNLIFFNYDERERKKQEEKRGGEMANVKVQSSIQAKRMSKHNA